MRTIHFLLALPLLLTACGETDPIELTNRGSAAVGKGEWMTAKAEFENALAHMDPSNPQYMRASVGRCQALARLEPAEGKAAFLKLAAANKDKIAVGDVHLVVSEFVVKKEFLLAADLMESAQAMFPDSQKLKELGESVATASRKAGDTKASARLKSLGYVGSTD
ncbi:MAG: hypothetical protein JNL28_00225 [Planctomycetes bacterium]|nr:hypothetical protein [Planctomycetota bacterium]